MITNGKSEVRPALLLAIAELSRLSPDWRLGQLIRNLADYAGDPNVAPSTVWDVCDDALLDAANALIRHRRAGEAAT